MPVSSFGQIPTKTPLGGSVKSRVTNEEHRRQPDEGPRRNRSHSYSQVTLGVWAFKTYATGEWTIRTLLEEVTKRGLLSKPTPKRPAQPMAISAFHKMLKNPYYIGIVHYCDIDYAGRQGEQSWSRP